MKKFGLNSPGGHIYAVIKKGLIIMKITLLLILVSTLNLLATDTYSQTARVSLNLNQTSLKQALKEIERSSEFYFLYNNELIDVERKVDINADNEQINTILDHLFANQEVKYAVYDRQIVISPANMPLPQEVQRKIAGKVTDQSGTSLPGVSVVVKGTTSGVITDTNGNFSLAIIPENATLVFSFVGMKTQEVNVVRKTFINVVLAEETIGIEEVVALGYGTMKKSDLTGSVASVSKKAIGDRTIGDIGSMIQGKVAGVDVENGQIRIRGVTSFNSTDPLVIIDGFLGGSMGNINPNDIESIEVLKDASSTAIYGARGANGVILVNTKNGKAGSLKVNINAYWGIAGTPKKIDMLSASQYVDYALDALTNAKMPITDRLRSPDVRIDRTNWQNEIFRTAKNSEVDIDLSGGSEKSTFFVSLLYKRTEAIYINPSWDNFNVRIKNQFNLKKWLKAGENISLSYNISKGTGPNAASGSLPFLTALPYMPVRDENNYWGFAKVDRTTDLSDAQNPVANVYLTHPETNSLAYQANLWADIEPLKGLVYHVQAGVTGGFSRYKVWNDQYANNAGGTIPADFTEQSTYNIYPVIESYLTYSHKIGSHDLKAMVGNTWQNGATTGGIGIYGQGFAKTTVKNVFQAQTRSVLNDNYAQYAYLSYFGRLNYQFSNRYLLTANVRRDASPRFAPGNRWGTFPSIALAWKMNEESFIKDLNLFDVLKLRASWGISGNDAIGEFRYLSQVWTNGVYYPLGNPVKAVQGATVVTDASQNIKWESTASKTVGVDMVFLKNALSVTAEYFIKNTNDILFAVPRASSLGYGLTGAGNAIINAASCENKGFELQVGYKNNKGLLKYSINANYTNINNVVTSLGLGQPYIDSPNRTEVGYPIGYLYGHVATGVFMTQVELDAANKSARDAALVANPALTGVDLAKIFYQYSTTSPGDLKFKDVNGDGKVDDKDRTMIGNPIPKHTYGLSLNLDYKGFDFNAYFQGVARSDVYYYAYTYYRGMKNTLNSEIWTLNRWRSEAEPGNGIVPRAIIGDPAGNTRPSSMMVYKGDYLKLKQLSIGYKFSENFVHKMGLSSIRIYTTGYNLLTFSKYPSYDPEFSSDNLNRGRDWYNFPMARSISFGIQVGL